MLLADVVIWFGACFALGSLSLLALFLAAIGKAIGAVWRLIVGAPTSQLNAPQPFPPRVRCPYARCGELNPTAARFCKRCGRALRHDDARINEMDLHG